MIIILPIETTARELDYKLDLGLFLASQATTSVLLSPTTYSKKIAYLLDGKTLLIGKHIFRNRAKQKCSAYAKERFLASQLHAIHLDEEGGLYLNCDRSEWDYARFKNRQPDLEGEVLAVNRLRFAHWGEYQQSLAQTINPLYGHFTTGVPAFDACKVLSQISKNYAAGHSSRPIIGVTGNACGLSQGLAGKYDLFESIIKLSIDDPSTEIEAIQSEINLILIATRLAKDFPQCDVAYRPHPSSSRPELFAYLKKISRQFSNFSISRPAEEPSLDYLRRIDLNIHSNCTTSLQSHFLKKPTLHISNLPYGFKSQLLKEVSCRPEEVVERVRQFLEEPGKFKIQRLTDTGRKLIANDDQKYLSSYQALAQEVSIMIGDSASNFNDKSIAQALAVLNRQAPLHTAKYLAKRLGRTILPDRIGTSQKSQTNTLYNSRAMHRKFEEHQQALAHFNPKVTQCGVRLMANGILVEPPSP